MSINNTEFNLAVVSSLVLQVRPETLEAVKAYLENKPNIEIHASDDFSKLVVVVEMENDIQLSEFMNEMSTVDGVITVNMVFHHTDSPEDLSTVNQIVDTKPQDESVITFKEAIHHA